jgi:membrane protein
VSSHGPKKSWEVRASPLPPPEPPDGSPVSRPMSPARAHKTHLAATRHKRPEGASATVQALHEAGFSRRTGRILARTMRAFVEDNITRLGAALAFYTTVAVAPLLVIAITVAGFFFDEQARERVLSEIDQLAGHQAGAAIAAVQNPQMQGGSVLATSLAVLMLIIGGFGVFQHLQDALNSIWRVRLKPSTGWRNFLRQRLFSLATVLVTGFLLLVSLIASAVLSWLNAQAMTRFQLPGFALQLENNLLTFAVVTFLFAVIFKLLPDTKVHWKHVWLGAVVTAFLFTAGKGALGWYLGRATVTSAYGAAGSIIVLLLWCYYAAQIVFLGAEFTRVTALSNGGRNFTPLDEDRKRTV